jgi:hypothetical protein
MISQMDGRAALPTATLGWLIGDTAFRSADDRLV